MISQFNGAVFDHHHQHRFLLWRFWNDSPRMLFIGLNPSTANELEDDPTVRRMCGFAQDWGYGGLYVCNLWSFVTPYPKELLEETRNHKANDLAIEIAISLSVLTVCGWGDGMKSVTKGVQRANFVYGKTEAPMCFGLTQSGNPKHPLYLPKTANLEEYCIEGYGD